MAQNDKPEVSGKTVSFKRESWSKQSIETPRFRQLAMSLTEPFRPKLSRNAPLSSGESQWSAIHEAGHAVAQYSFKGSFPERVYLSNQGGEVHDFGNCGLAKLLCGNEPVSLEQLAPDIEIYIAGALAELLITDSPRWDFAQSDIGGALQLAEYATEKPHEYIETLIAPTVQLLVDKWNVVVAVAAELIRKTKLNARDVQLCIELASKEIAGR